MDDPRLDHIRRACEAAGYPMPENILLRLRGLPPPSYTRCRCRFEPATTVPSRDREPIAIGSAEEQGMI